jgi:hypothetical protein
MLKNQPETVRIFVFKHECGHLTVGDSELKADCYAVQQGVREHWLDRKGLDQVCQSFDGAPETDTHPSAARRCRNLDQCFAAALATEAKANPAAPNATPVPGSVAAKPAPKKAVVANRPPAPKPAASQAAIAARATAPPPKEPTVKAALANRPAPKAPAAAAPPVVEAPPAVATGSTPNAAIPPAEAWGVPVNDDTADAARRAVSSWRCTEPLRVSDAGGDAIGHLIGEDAKTAAGCR